MFATKASITPPVTSKLKTKYLPANGTRVEQAESFSGRRSPLAWYGSKSRLVPHLLQLCSPHTCYVEVFGGSGALLFGKQPSPVEVFNDLHNEVVHFFRLCVAPTGL